MTQYNSLNRLSTVPKTRRLEVSGSVRETPSREESQKRVPHFAHL